MPTDETVDFATAMTAIFHEGKLAQVRGGCQKHFVREGRVFWREPDGTERRATGDINDYVASRWHIIEPPPPLPKLPKLFRAKVKHIGDDVCGMKRVGFNLNFVDTEGHWYAESELTDIRYIELKE